LNQQASYVRPAPTVSCKTAGLRPCYIHIGTHKTGTTSIQAFLASNRVRFAANGVFWPAAGSDGDPNVVSHHELARELNRGGAFDSEKGGLDAVAEELRGSDARIACLSSEDFTFLWDKPSALIRLRDAVLAAGFSPRIVVYFRPQASYCTAVYAENVRHGYRKPFEEYFHNILTHGQYVWEAGVGPPFDYPRLLDSFAAVFGRNSIIVRPYRSAAPNDAILFSFARILLPNVDVTSFVTPTIRYNGSLDFGAVLTLLGSEQPIPARLRFTPLGSSQMLRLELRFRRSNAALARCYGTSVPAFEPLDLALALPLRRTPAKTRALLMARRALAEVG
jgi:hypothetical protein